MKAKAESHFYPVLLISLFTLFPSLVFGAGLAAIKEQSFHQDAGANIVVYSELKESGPSVKIETTNRTFTIERQKLAGKIEVISTLPANITSDTELEPVRKTAKEYRDFTTRFPKSAPLLSQHITALDTCIKEFEGGKARYNSEWMPKEQVLAAKQKEEQSRNEEVAAIKRKYEEKRAFEESQKAKGLAKYDGKWLPADEVRRIVERDQAILDKEAGLAIEAEKQAAETRKMAEAKQAAEALAVKSAKRIKGIVKSATIEGLLVDCNDYSNSVASSSASVGGGGNVYTPSDPIGRGRPPTVSGLFWITGHPKQDSLVDKDRIDIDAIEDGVYEYTSAGGAACRVKKYRVHKVYQ